MTKTNHIYFKGTILKCAADDITRKQTFNLIAPDKGIIILAKINKHIKNVLMPVLAHTIHVCQSLNLNLG